MNTRDALYNLVHEYPGGAELLAKRMGLAASTIYSMVNPNLADTHDWSLRRFRQAIHYAADRRPLEALCAEFGGVFVEIPQGDDRNLDEVYRLIANLGKEFGDVTREVMDDLKDGKLEPKEFARIEREILELQQAAAEVRRHLDTLVVRRPHLRPVPG